MAQIQAAVPDAALERVALDLSSQASVKAAAGQILAARDRLDLLVNNAGVMAIAQARTVDGFEMVFMRLDGDHLNAGDAYTSPWLGDERGGSPNNVSSEGKVPVGLQGRAAKEVNALGLIVLE